MAHPLEDYRLVSKVSFLNISKWDLEHFPSHLVHRLDKFVKEHYEELERDAQKIIDSDIREILDEKKQIAYIKPVIAELKDIQDIVAKFDLEGIDGELRVFLLRKLELFIAKLSKIHLNAKVLDLQTTPKIQWKGDLKVLTTLFYDLWQGQEDAKGIQKLQPLINAEKKDLTALLINNFIDNKGIALDPGTISYYLSRDVSKDDRRSKIGARIELKL